MPNTITNEELGRLISTGRRVWKLLTKSEKAQYAGALGHSYYVKIITLVLGIDYEALSYNDEANVIYAMGLTR